MPVDTPAHLAAVVGQPVWAYGDGPGVVTDVRPSGVDLLAAGHVRWLVEVRLDSGRTVVRDRLVVVPLDAARLAWHVADWDGRIVAGGPGVPHGRAVEIASRLGVGHRAVHGLPGEEEHDMDDTPTREPMRPRGTPRKMRKPGRQRRSFQPDLDSLLNAASRVDLMRTHDGRYRDLSGRPVDQKLARDAVRHGLIAKTTWPGDLTYSGCYLPAERVARIATFNTADKDAR